jgi:hypothetical protein
LQRCQCAAAGVGLIDYPGKVAASGKRPRAHLTTRQTKLASYLPEIELPDIEATLTAAGQTNGVGCAGRSAVRRSRGAPRSS